MANIGSLSAKQMRASTQAQNVYTIASHTGAIGSTLSGLTLTGSNGLSFNDLTVNLQGEGRHYKKYEIIESNEDLLTLSCVWYRFRQERNANKSIGISPSKLLDNVLFENIKEEDRELASKIRDYYSKKIMMLTLKSITFTKYRNDLNKFIHGDGLKFEESICGLVYRLPEFYEYDIEFDEMVRECNKQIAHSVSRDTHTLTHIGTLRVNKKTSKRIEYWFKTENNDIANISLEPNNPLLKVWDKLMFDDLRIEAKYGVKRRDDMAYYVLTDYSIV